MPYLLRLALFVALAFPLPALAAEATGHRPAPYAKVGTVNRIDRERRVAVIGDRLYRCAPGLQVHTAERVHGSLYHLRTGQRVGLRLQPGDPRPAAVEEIWVLPAEEAGDARPD